MKLRVFGIILLFAVLVVPAGCENYKTQLDELQTQYDSLSSQYEEILNENQALQDQVEDIQRDLQEVQEELKLYRDSGIRVYSYKQPGVTKNVAMSEVVLENNSSAQNPTWNELMLFLEQDDTDSELYGFMLCGGFAELVHNNAESAGIASAFVAINFEEGIGHALNAFNTIDRGLVYIDCTGKDINSYYVHLPGYVYIGDIDSYDTMAYLEIGKPVGHINIGLSYGLDYSDYEQWKLDVQDIVDRFNEATTNEELQQIKELSDSTLGNFWKEDSAAIVESIEIYW
jgi:hypothetical protein